jgi:regulator of PEP synthase PpsR (kinase-PPPase family)
MAFFISDSTGITAETLGRSLLTQFQELEFDQTTIPYVNTVEKAKAVLERINQASHDIKSKLSEKIGFKVLSHEIRPTRLQQDQQVLGNIFVLSKNIF